MDATTPLQQFIQDMRSAGFTVNQFTFADGTTLPTVYGSSIAVRRKTTVPVSVKPMGNFEIVFPAIKK